MTRLRLAVMLACSLAATAADTGAATVTIDWSHERLKTRTAATIEVDVMPFLGQTTFGGPFDAYHKAMAELDAEYVRFAPWTPNPRVTVPELTAPDCNASSPATNWNSTLLDGVMADFFSAVCGEGAAQGACRRSVIMQLSTMPSWMYIDGMDLKDVPADPWVPTLHHKDYADGSALVDPSCEQMARHIGRVVGWYTLGGFHDDCGHWHASGLKYNWWGLSILNEDEHGVQPDDGRAYVTCYDAVAARLALIGSAVVPVGPEISGDCAYPSGEVSSCPAALRPPVPRVPPRLIRPHPLHAARVLSSTTSPTTSTPATIPTARRRASPPSTGACPSG